MQQQLAHEPQGQSPEEAVYDAPYTTDLPVGEILRRARVHYGLSLKDIEKSLRIRAIQLGALESGNVESLPGRVYAIGFIRSYSEFLGLDGDKMVQLFKAQYSGSKSRPELNFPVPASESKLPSISLLGGSAAALLVVIILAVVMSGNTTTESIPPVPKEIEVTGFIGPQKPFEKMEPLANELADIQPAAGVEEKTVTTLDVKPSLSRLPNNIQLQVNKNVWLEIRDQNQKVIISKILKEGETYQVPDQDELVMDTADAGAFDVILNGEKLAKLGKPGQIRRDISLNPEQLKPDAQE